MRMLKAWVASGATPLLAMAVPLYNPGQGQPLAPGTPVVNRPSGCSEAKKDTLLSAKTGFGTPVAVNVKSYRAPASPSGGRPLVNTGDRVATPVVLSRTDIVVLLVLSTAKSTLPSLLRSPATICKGPGPVGIVNGAWKLPLPLPNRTHT